MFNALLPALQSKQLKAEDRFNIANDVFALVESNKMPATRFLDFMQASVNEDEYIVWKAIDSGVAQLRNALDHHSDASVVARFNQFVTKCYLPLGEKMGWEAKEGEGNTRI